MVAQSIFSRIIGRYLAIAGFIGALLAATYAEAQDCSCYGSGASPSGNVCIVNNGGSFSTKPACSSQTPLQVRLAALKAAQAQIMSQIDNSTSPAEKIGLGIQYSVLGNEAAQVSAQIAAGATHLGMYVSPGPSGAFEGVGIGGASVMHGIGYGLTDSAGIFGPGAATPSFKDVSGGGGIAGTYDATALLGLPGNQGLLLGYGFDYRSDNITFGAFAGVPLPNIGSAKENTYSFQGGFLYHLNSVYLIGTGSVAFGNGTETLLVDGSTGSFGKQAYFGDVQLGNLFPLFRSADYRGGLITKGPPVAAGGGYAILLDVSGHLGYSSNHLDGFVDTAGFLFGGTQTQYGAVGGQAKLLAPISSNGWVWMPYLAATIDQRFGFSNTLTLPNQPAQPGGDIINLHEAQTYYGAQLGLDVRAANGWTVGVKGFVYASADTNSEGGNVYVKIPLWSPPPPAPALVAKY